MLFIIRSETMCNCYSSLFPWHLLIYLCNGFTHILWTFLGQGLNLSHSCSNVTSFNSLLAGEWTRTSPASLAAAVGFLTTLHHSGNPLALVHKTLFFSSAELRTQGVRQLSKWNQLELTHTIKCILDPTLRRTTGWFLNWDPKHVIEF